MTHTGRLKRKSRTVYAPRRVTAWLAVLALAVQVLVPFGQAMAFDPAQGIEYQVICTANGVKQVAIDQDGAPIEVQEANQCPFCFAHSVLALIQPETTAANVVGVVDNGTSLVRPTHAQHASIWRGALRPSRAPPFTI